MSLTQSTLGCWGIRRGFLDTPPADFYARVDSAARAPACAVRSDGTLACWSENGELSLPPEQHDYVDVAADVTSICGLRESGEILCKGEVRHESKDAVQISSADLYSLCALSQQGLVECVGESAPRGRFVQISSGHSSGCALD